MIHTGICPHCRKKIANVKVEEVVMKFEMNQQRRGLSYQCLNCKIVLGVQMNPYTLNEGLKNDILNELQ